MTISEQWIKWEPIKNLAPKYYIDSISDNIDEFSITLSDADNKNKIKVTFETLVLSYRSTNESFRLSIIKYLDECNIEYSKWTFFKIINSTYIQWLSEQSYGIIESIPPTHFSFVAGDSIVDVIAVYEPKVDFI
jgi:hypothetical protein